MALWSSVVTAINLVGTFLLLLCLAYCYVLLIVASVWNAITFEIEFSLKNKDSLI